MKKFIKPSLAIALGLFASQSAGAAELVLEKGTMSLGGSAGFSLAMAGGETMFSFGANPSFGYFVTDNIQVFGSISLEYMFEEFSWGIGVGGNYILDIGGMKGYGGIHYDINGVDNMWVGAQFGLLFPLSESVALDLSIRPDYGIQDEVFMLNAGWLGVNAYF